MRDAGYSQQSFRRATQRRYSITAILIIWWVSGQARIQIWLFVLVGLGADLCIQLKVKVQTAQLHLSFRKHRKNKTFFSGRRGKITDARIFSSLLNRCAQKQMRAAHLRVVTDARCNTCAFRKVGWQYWERVPFGCAARRCGLIRNRTASQTEPGSWW